MRYYLYVSDAKVEMLFPQVHEATQQKVAAKFGFDIKLFSASVETQQDTFNSRIARLHAVEEHLRSREEVGTPRDETSWIGGTLDAKFLDIGNGAILFVSHDADAFIGLGGSSHHLIGNSPPEKVSIPYSFLPSLIQQLTLLADTSRDYWHYPESDVQRLAASGVSQGFDAWISVIDSAWSSRVEVQRIDFLAKRLVTKRSRSGNEKYTLATPLYVALDG